MGRKQPIKAVFCFKIPLIKPNETEKSPLLQAKVHFEPQKLKILVEDDSISLKFISKIFKNIWR
jgi:hypothetical protein